MHTLFYVYIARCADKSLYVGITKDISERENRHNAGVGSIYTRTRRPVTIVYTEYFSTRGEAAKREKQLKGWTRAKKEHLILFGHPNPNKKQCTYENIPQKTT
jgi:putative endonuclease